jgi:hypothetical protein
MRRMLLLGSAVAVAGVIAVLAVSGGGPTALERRGPEVRKDVAAPESGPFALAATRAQADANAERHRAAREAYEVSGPYGDDENGYGRDDDGRDLPRIASENGTRRTRRMRFVDDLADRLDVSERRMWDAMAAVRRQISPRGFSDARDEAVAILAFELRRRPSEVSRAIRAEIRQRDLERGRP